MKSIFTVIGLVAVLASSSCMSTAKEEAPKARELTDAEGNAYLSNGPTTSLDTGTRSDPTTLQILESQTQQIDRLQSKIKELEAEQDNVTKMASDVAQTEEKRDREFSNLQDMLARAIEENKQLTDDLLKSRLLRLKMEREMILSRLAEIPEDGN